MAHDGNCITELDNADECECTRTDCFDEEADECICEECDCS